MENLRQQILELLNQDLMLESAFKARVKASLHELGTEKLNKILEALTKLVNEETTVMEETLKRKPHFFTELQHQILDLIHQQFEKEEEGLKQSADIQLETELTNLN